MCGRRESVSCVWEEGKGQLCVGGWKGPAECGNMEWVFWVWQVGSVCCMWEDGRGLLSVGTWKGSSGSGRREGSAVCGRMEGAC